MDIRWRTHFRDNLICDKLSYRFTDPERFDIVVIYPDDQKDKRWIKRIIGLPGETVRIDEEGNIYINGEILDEDYGREVIQDPGLAAQEITLQEAAVCGVYLHGKAADISGIDIGLAAGELAQFLPEARHEVLKGN